MKLVNFMSRSNNNFDLIRLIAATCVIWDHSFLISSGATFGRPFVGYSVPLFGFISGLVICNSIFSRQKPLSFLISITTRLWIPLLLVTSFSAFVLGPMVSSIGAVEYFQLYFSDALKYVTRSAFFRPLMEIPTAFDTNRLHLINGNIWCISYFFGGYLFLLALWMLGIARKGVNGGVVFIAAAFLLMVYCYHILDLQPLQHKAPSQVLIASILLGAGVCCLKDQISVKGGSINSVSAASQKK